MGDRSNPILFGPEWLRNLPAERGSGNSGGQHSGNNMNNPNNQTAGPGTSGAGAVSSMAPPGHRRNGTSAEAGGSQSSNQQASNGSAGGVRVQLANLRYGREEMLALYDAASEPPQELKNNELLYQPRGKPPFALSTTFDEEMRDRDMRSSPHTSGMSTGDRFNSGRGGSGRVVAPNADNSNRPRFRATAMQRSPTASSSVETQGDPGTRPQLNPRARYQPNEHKGFNLNYAGANSSVMFRNNKRQNTNWNWRSSQTRESADEWRDSARARSGQDRERDRERPGDRPQGGSNRRTTSDHHEESMPEWAYTNAEACAGTFDSSGAFHGYSNDDSNLPKNNEGAYSLARSRTHNTLTRSKTAEEGSDEWWASEKAKKLSPKRFDAGDIKFKQGPGLLDGAMKPMSQNSKSGSNKEDYEEQKDSPVESPEPEDKHRQEYEELVAERNSYKQQFSENKAYDNMLRNEMNMEEQNNDCGNFKSVMINTNNSLRQKHQNIVVAAVDNQIPMNRSHPVMLKFQNQNQHMETEQQKQHHMLEEKMIDRFLDMSLENDDLASSRLMGPSGSGVSGGHSVMPLSMPGGHNPGHLSLMNAQLSTLNLQPPTHIPLPPVGMTSTMVLPPHLDYNPNSAIGLPMPGMPQGMPSHGHGLGGTPLQNPVAMPSFQSGGNMPGMSNNAANTSLLFGKNLSNSTMPQTGDIPMPPSHNAQNANLFPMHGLQHSNSQSSFGNSMFNNLLPSQSAANQNAIGDQWFYEDPEKNTQGPFTSREMYTWYRAGFFTPSLMVRRACEAQMRPLGSYGPMPFVQLDMLPPFPMSGYETRAPLNHSGLGPSVMNVPNISEPTSHMKPLQNVLQIQMQNPMHIQMQIPMPNHMQNQMQNQLQNQMQNQMQHQMHSPMHNVMHIPMPNQMQNQMHSPMQNQMLNQLQNQMHSPMLNPRANAVQNQIQNTMQFGNVGIARNPPLGPQQNMFDSLWGQPPQDVMWMQRNPPIENRVNNLPMYFWDQQASNSLLPEDITKEMKTEDQILAQLRASQNNAIGAPANMSSVEPATPLGQGPQEDAFASAISAPYFEELQKMIQKDIHILTAPVREATVETRETQPPKQQKVQMKHEQYQEQVHAKVQIAPAAQPKNENKLAKQAKLEHEKTLKNKENASTKSKNKKSKEDKKDDVVEIKAKENDSNKAEQKRSLETSPVKNKKDEKANKKELEKEKKEWLKEGFTIVKSTEKVSKDSKKKVDEAKAAEEVEKKRKDEERQVTEDDKKKKQADSYRKQHGDKEHHHHQPRNMTETFMKKAPWSAATQLLLATSKEGLTLTEIQRLEREKKLEQMKEQQQMMAILAQQQAANMAREQEMQANLGWNKKKGGMQNIASQSLAEIQAETRKQASVAAASTQVFEEERAPIHSVPWTNAPNAAGFWDTPAAQTSSSTPQRPEKAQESKPETSKPKKKAPPLVIQAPVVIPVKKETSPAMEFEVWCAAVLKSWSSKIDVPTFIGFLKDIESPYEVKDYVKCYLGESKETGDFSRQFLEKRSKLMRVRTVTPSDDLCSPAIAVNPRTNSGSDYQEVKGKGKKTKKNKMQKVDARILGFSVTASEDRINVGDIDSA